MYKDFLGDKVMTERENYDKNTRSFIEKMFRRLLKAGGKIYRRQKHFCGG
jgi:hypothetical protein